MQKTEKRPPLTFDSSLFNPVNDKLLLIITNISGLACLFLLATNTQFVVLFNRHIMIDDKHTCSGCSIKIKLNSCLAESANLLHTFVCVCIIPKLIKLLFTSSVVLFVLFFNLKWPIKTKESHCENIFKMFFQIKFL